ncbi:histone H2A deubiquitinase MYSM1-like [Patiria miniata]|uniref:Myb-like, SWIRM and MPN domain-containing protein 1 n=1 Tax=Patiria miniata TaxID=46514 RepID=A0A913ZBV9_PATMI|nr:histone H2A deubiquitinase MYSM1-like [Patiria miniata]
MADEIQDIEDEIDVEGFDEKEGSSTLLPDDPALPPKKYKNETSIRSRIWKEFGVPVCDWSVDDMDPESRLTIEKMLHEERRYLRTSNGPVTRRPKKKPSPYLRWTPQERQQFEQGFMSYGNRWTQIARLIPTRSPLQVKNYARYYFPAKLQSASDESLDDDTDQDGVNQDVFHPHLPESLNTGSPTIATRPVAPTARGIATPSKRRHFQKFGFANLSPSRVLKSRSGKDALASMKRIADGRSAKKLTTTLEGGAARPTRKMRRGDRGRARRAGVKTKDERVSGLVGYQRDGSRDAAGGSSVDLFEQGGGVVRMRPESSEDEDVDVEEDVVGDGDNHQENLLMGLADACDRIYNNLITPSGNYAPPTATNPDKRARRTGARPKSKVGPDIPGRSKVRGHKVIMESLSIPELPWNADHTYSMSLRTLHKLGILRGVFKPAQDRAERGSGSQGRRDTAQCFNVVSESKVVALRRGDTEDFIGDEEAFSPKSERGDSIDDLPRDGEMSLEFKTEPEEDDSDVVWNIEPTECHVKDEPCHVDDATCHVKDEPRHTEDESCHVADEPCHVTDEPCHVSDTMCHVKDEPCHMKDELCHMTDKLCRVVDERCHVKDDPCLVKDRLCHTSEEICHVKEEPCDEACSSSDFDQDDTYLLVDMCQPVEPFPSKGPDTETPLFENPEVQPADSPVHHPGTGSYQEQELEGFVTSEESTSAPRLVTAPAPLEKNTGSPETEVGSDCETGGSNQEDENRGDMTSNAMEGEADSNSGGDNEQTAGLLGEYLLDLEEIEDWEKKALPEFFKGRPTKTPERYLKIRNYIHQQWLQIKPKYLNKAAVRQGLKSCGDVNCIGRIHHSLEKAGAINYGVANPHRSIIDCRVNALRQRMATKTSDQRASRESKRPRKKKNLHPESEISQKSDEKLPQRKSVRSGPRKTKAVPYDPFKLIECCRFTEEKEAPFHVRIQSDAMIIMDVHSHMSSTEVIGLLGGKFCKEDNMLDVLLAVPCNSISTGMQCEMDPVSQTEAYESILAKDYQVVGWYHSHPAFAANPSVRDIETQSGFQGWFSQGGAPFIGIIVSPCHNYQISQSKVCCLTISAEWSSELKCRKPYQFDFTVSHSHCDNAHTMDTISSVVTKFSVYKHRSEMLYLWSRHYDISFLEKMLLSIKTYICPSQQGDLLMQIKDLITAEFTAKTVLTITDEDDN